MTDDRAAAEFETYVREMVELVMGEYISKDDVVDVLFDQAGIDPIYTRTLWMRLEEKNKDFFKAYYKRVVLKKQIEIFNRLAEEHLQVMKMIKLLQYESNQIENNSVPVDGNCTRKYRIRAMGDASTHDRINGSSPQRDLSPMEENVEMEGSAGLTNGSIYESENVKEFAELEFRFPELSECTLSTIFTAELGGDGRSSLPYEAVDNV